MTASAFSLLKPRICTDSPVWAANQLSSLVKKLNGKKQYSYRYGDKGQATFLVKHSREQRVIVKVSYAKNTKGRSWAAHGQYLQREHAQMEGKKGLGFNDKDNDIDLRKNLKKWQASGDERFFKVILSPEGAAKLDLQAHARELMRQAENDLGTKLQWMAIDHNNTEHGHIHILIRGVDGNGKELTIDPTYIAEGFRHRSQEIATLKLGLRTQHDMSLARTQQIEKSYLTELDRNIRLRSVDNIVNYHTKIPQSLLSQERRLQEIKRLKFLETLGLAEKISHKMWRISPNLEKTLKAMQLSNDIIKSRAHHGLSTTDYTNLLVQTELSDVPLVGKIVGMDLKNSPATPKNHSPAFEFNSKLFTDWDRSLQVKAVNRVVSFETPIPYSALERKRRLQEIKRLKFLETLGLAEKIGAKRWILSETFAQTLHTFSREQNVDSDNDIINGGLKPTLVTEETPITGKVVGMGLDNELHDRRYLLLEGTDGKIHYIRATESIVKARDQSKFCNEDIITLSRKTFITEEEKESVSFIQVNNHRHLSDILKQKISVLDDEVVRYVERYQQAPRFNALHESASEFTRSFMKEMILRFKELEQQGLFVRYEDKVELTTNYLSRLDDIQHRRFGEFTLWQPHLDSKQEDLTLVGTIVAGNDRNLLVKDIRGQYYRVSNQSLGIDSPFKEGKEVYLRVHKIPKLEFTNTDKRLVEYLCGGGYSYKAHAQILIGELNTRKDFFLKDKNAVDSFVLAHQRRADTWVKWGFVALEEGTYKISPDMAEKLNKEGIGLAIAMQHHLDELKKKYELAVKERPCLFTMLTEKSIKHDEKKIVLLDRILKEVGLPPKGGPAKISAHLNQRADLWQSRGVALDKDFEKNARQWFTESQTLEQVAERIKKPLSVAMEKSKQQYKGKVVAMGSMDNLDQPHLLLETENALLALPMKRDLLCKYVLNQDISLEYQSIQVNKARVKKLDISNSKGDLTLGDKNVEN